MTDGSDAIVATTREPAERICTKCARSKPISDYRLKCRTTGRRATWCRACHAESERARRQRHANERSNRRLYKAWRDLANVDNRRRSVEKLVAGLMRSYGGPTGLASAWKQALDTASASRRIRAAESALRLIIWTRQHAATLNVADMDDATLDLERGRLLLDAMRTRPELVRAIAHRIGFDWSDPIEKT
jgi:hypothetical protein